MRTILTHWLVPAAIAVLVFAVVRPTLAQIAEREAELTRQLAGQNVTAGEEIVGGWRQVYYEIDGKKTLVTNGEQNSYDPVIDGEYMVWVTSINGAGQIFLYHIPTEETIQLTHGSTNLNPSLYDNKAAWERWVNDRWQVFFFDGVRTFQLTQTDLAVEPHVTAEGVLFARKDDGGAWRAERYMFVSNTIELVEKGLAGKLAVLRGSRVATVLDISPSPTPEATSGVEPTPAGSPVPSDKPMPSEEPTASPLPNQPQSVSQEEIEQELKETVPATPSPTPIPSPSPEPDPLVSPTPEVIPESATLPAQ